MSYAVDAAAKLHDRQVEAATKMQNLVVKAADGLAGLRDKAPETPERIAAPLGKVTGPVTKVVGSPSEVAAYVAQSGRDWVELQQKFAESLFEIAWGKPESATPATTTKAKAKKSS